MPRRPRATTVFIVTLLCTWTLASAQPPSRSDPPAELVAAAKKEGKVEVYSSWPSNMEQEIGKAFQERYGIRVNLFRAGGEQIAQKMELEFRARKPAADVLNHTERTYTLMLKRRGQLLQHRPLNTEKFDPGDVDAEGYFATSGGTLATIIYNKALVKPEDAPRSFKELADPRWKDQTVNASPIYGGSQLATLKGLLEMHGWDWLQAWKKNGVMMVQAYPEVENTVIKGERKVGVDQSVRLSQALKAGQPLGVSWPTEGAIAVVGTVSVLKSAANPNAAKLYVDFLLSEEGQRVYVRYGATSPRPGMPSPEHLPPLDKIKLHRINQAALLDERNSIKQRWTDTMEVR